jgi:hypothetical protein
MLYISYGMPKSASSFAFQLAAAVAGHLSKQSETINKMPEHLRASYFDDINVQFKELDSLVSRQDILVLKTHGPLGPDVKQKILNGQALASITLRDPYDILVSLLDAGTRERERPESEQRPFFSRIFTMEDALTRIPYQLHSASVWMNHVGDSANCLILRFDELTMNPASAVGKFAEHMDVICDHDSIAQSFISDKSKIREFNVGKSGRGHTEIEVPERHPVKSLMDKFIERYLS